MEYLRHGISQESLDSDTLRGQGSSQVDLRMDEEETEAVRDLIALVTPAQHGNFTSTKYDENCSAGGDRSHQWTKKVGVTSSQGGKSQLDTIWGGSNVSDSKDYLEENTPNLAVTENNIVQAEVHFGIGADSSTTETKDLAAENQKNSSINFETIFSGTTYEEDHDDDDDEISSFSDSDLPLPEAVRLDN